MNVALNYSRVLPSVAESEKWIIKSAQRVLQVFEYFAEVRQPASATEISHALGFPQSSTSMLLRSLVSLGYLEFHREVRKFEPTIRLSLLGGWIPERIEVASHIIDTVNQLHEEFGERVMLAEPHRNYVRYFYVLQRPASGATYYVRPGTLRPICATASGRMFMTLCAEREIVSIINRANSEEADPERWINRKEFLETIAKCRQDGIAYTEVAAEGLVSVQAAVLLPADGSARRFAVGVFSEQGRFAAIKDAVTARLLEVAKG